MLFVVPSPEGLGLFYKFYKAKKNILFVSCNGLKEIRVDRSVKNLFLHYFFCQKFVF